MSGEVVLVLEEDVDNLQRVAAEAVAEITSLRSRLDAVTNERNEAWDKHAADQFRASDAEDKLDSARSQLTVARQALERIEGGHYDAPEDDDEALIVAMQDDARRALTATDPGGAA